MQVFILGTGRCGTLSFAQACGHITNFTAAHESRVGRWGDDRLAYPPRHIEVDCRLVWFAGALARRYPEAFYVHLQRDREAVANSLLLRWPTDDSPQLAHGMIGAFSHSLVMHGRYTPADRIQLCRFYVDTVTTNIEEFLEDKPSMSIDIAEADRSFPELMDKIGADVDLDAALAEFETKHNSSAAITEAFSRALAERNSRSDDHR